MCFGTKARRDSNDTISSSHRARVLLQVSDLDNDTFIPLQRPAQTRPSDPNEPGSIRYTSFSTNHNEARRASQPNIERYPRLPRRASSYYPPPNPTGPSAVEGPRSGNGQATRISSFIKPVNLPSSQPKPASTAARRHVPQTLTFGTLGSKIEQGKGSPTSEANANPAGSQSELLAPKEGPFCKPSYAASSRVTPDGRRASNPGVRTKSPVARRPVPSQSTTTTIARKPVSILPSATRAGLGGSGDSVGTPRSFSSPGDPGGSFSPARIGLRGSGESIGAIRSSSGPAALGNSFSRPSNTPAITASTARTRLRDSGQNVGAIQSSSGPGASGSSFGRASITTPSPRHNSPPASSGRLRSNSIGSSTSSISSVSTATLDSMDRRQIQGLALKRARKQLLKSISGRPSSTSSSSSSDLDPDLLLFAMRRDMRNKAKIARRKAMKQEKRKSQKSAGVGGGGGDNAGTLSTAAGSPSTTIRGFGDFLEWKKHEAVKERLRSVLGPQISNQALQPSTFEEFCTEKQMEKEKETQAASGSERPKPSGATKPAPSLPPQRPTTGSATTSAPSNRQSGPLQAKQAPRLLVPLSNTTTAATAAENKSSAVRQARLTAEREKAEKEKSKRVEEARQSTAASMARQSTSAPGQKKGPNFKVPVLQTPGQATFALPATTAPSTTSYPPNPTTEPTPLFSAPNRAGSSLSSTPQTRQQRKGPNFTVPVLATSGQTRHTAAAASTPTFTTATTTPPNPTPQFLFTSKSPAQTQTPAPSPTTKSLSCLSTINLLGPDAPGAISIAEVAQNRRKLVKARRSGGDDSGFPLQLRGVVERWLTLAGTWTTAEMRTLRAIQGLLRGDLLVDIS